MSMHLKNYSQWLFIIMEINVLDIISLLSVLFFSKILFFIIANSKQISS